MEKKRDMRREETYSVAEQFDEAERKFDKSGRVEQTADEAAPKSYREAQEVGPDEDVLGERAQHDDPSVPDSKHKEKRKGGKDRDKPYRTIDRSRPK